MGEGDEDSDQNKDGSGDDIDHVPDLAGVEQGIETFEGDQQPEDDENEFDKEPTSEDGDGADHDFEAAGNEIMLEDIVKSQAEKEDPGDSQAPLEQLRTEGYEENAEDNVNDRGNDPA